MKYENLQELANVIRKLTFVCKSKDVMSCEFGNEFNKRVLDLLVENVEMKHTCSECGGNMVSTGSFCRICFNEG